MAFAIKIENCSRIAKTLMARTFHKPTKRADLIQKFLLLFLEQKIDFTVISKWYVNQGMQKP